MKSIDLHVVSTHGAVRKENQDAALARMGEGGELFAIISDGMGGHESGREAAEIVVRSCSKSACNSNGQPAAEVSGDALRAAHRLVLQAAEASAASRMGATAVLATIDTLQEPPVLNLAHVGDSRAYLCRGNSIYRLTSDHSQVAQLVRDGLLTEEQAFGHPDSNILQRAIGQSAPLEPEVQKPMALVFGDTLVLCSDGLHGVIPDQEILSIVRRSSASAEACRELVEAALAARSEDNISVVCVRLPESGRKPRSTRPAG